MKRYRILLLTILVLALILLLGSELFFDRPFNWIPGREFLSQRHQMFLARAGIDEVTRHILLLIASLVSLFGIGTFVIYALPKRVRYIAESLAHHPTPLWGYLGVGLVGAMGIGATTFLSVFSVYTFPASLLLLLLLFTSTVLGMVGMSYQLGYKLLHLAEWRVKNPLVPFGLGMFILYSAIRIPYLGIVFLLFVGLACLGASLATRFGSGNPWTFRPFVEDEI
ncbi:MAG: hypothetical protein A2Z14_19200 [Chloroflexi bacterium RBG_16_48_8]|nr:MAG: hypothetical protein A2Z14_19200 [Chloroflexi bacterium RBG_16_48_8]